MLGPEGEAFERELAQALGAREAVAVANGTDALQLSLRALGVGPGDEVITTSISAAFTALAIVQAGARPVFVDVDPATLNLDPRRAAEAVTGRTRAILPVHLYGHPAEMAPLLELANERGLTLLEDACQADGARFDGRPVGTLRGELGIGALSFYPTKNLGALGDGGAVVVNDAATASRLRVLRNGGQSNRYRHESFGINSRLDELQAAILRVGLAHLPAWTERRRALAAFYLRELAGCGVELPAEQPYARARLPPLRGAPSAARRPGAADGGAWDRYADPLPDPLAPAAGLRRARRPRRRLPRRRAGLQRDSLAAASSRCHATNRPLRLPRPCATLPGGSC